MDSGGHGRPADCVPRGSVDADDLARDADCSHRQNRQVYEPVTPGRSSRTRRIRTEGARWRTAAPPSTAVPPCAGRVRRSWVGKTGAVGLWLPNHWDCSPRSKSTVMTRAGARHQSGRGVDEGEASAHGTAIVAKDEGPQHDQDVRPTQSEVENGERVGAGVSWAAGWWSLDMFHSPWGSLRVVLCSWSW